MDDELGKIFQQAGTLAALLRAAFRETTGEEFDLESAIRHSPLVALGLAAGAGFLGGWWVANRMRPALPPASERRLPPGSSKDVGPSMADNLDRLRRSFPNLVSEQHVESTRTWIESFVEPQVKHYLDEAVSSASEGKFGQFLQGHLNRWGLNGETRLDDPTEPE